MKLAKYLSLIALVFFCDHLVFSQNTVWSEDFDSYADGITTGLNNNTVNPAVDWTSGGCASCGGSPDDYWEIRNGAMEARDVNDDHVFLQTESIDISGLFGVSFNVDVLESGDLEGLYLGTDDCADASNQDYADVEYRIDGGPWILVQNYLGWCGLYASCGTHTLYGDDNSSGDCRTTDNDWVFTTVIVSGISGSTLEIRLSATNSAGTEYIQFDDLEVHYTTALPIELVEFTATTSNETIVDLNWQTASETNNDYFIIERSVDGNSWENLNKKILGQGNSSILTAYHTTDNNPLTGISYYRLKQVDFDGTVSYTTPISILLERKLKPCIRVFPNPSHDQITVLGKQKELENLKIYNYLGQDVTNMAKTVNNDGSKTVIEISGLRPGLYFIKSESDCKILTVN